MGQNDLTKQSQHEWACSSQLSLTAYGMFVLLLTTAYTAYYYCSMLNYIPNIDVVMDTSFVAKLLL